ncbi:MAG TPA: AEC family transporter [Candidatus Onthovicinus excrementipullorum]|nr:AEC family transporter [Candidatus Onthovicinus excrementipullorum]
MFIENMLTAAQQVAILAILVVAGLLCDKAGIYTEKASRLTNNLLFYIVTPAVIVESFLRVEMTPDSLNGLLMSALCGVIIHVAAIVLTLPLFRRGDRDENCVFKYASIYGNTGYMALPLASAVLGEEGVFYCSAGIVVFNVFCFTHGVWLMRKEGDAFRFKKLLVNPGTISLLIGLPLFLANVSLPQVLAEPVGLLADLNTPLAMILFGTYLAHTRFRTLFSRPRAYAVAFFKLIVLPLLMIGCFYLMGLQGTLMTACVITAAVPSANNTIMFAAKYDKDTGLASQTVSLVSILSIVTMPVMIALAGAI